MMDPGIAVRLDPRLAARLEDKKARLDLLRPLPPAVVQRLADDMRVLLTYHSNAIEGNTLSLYETKMVIEEGVTISGQESTKKSGVRRLTEWLRFVSRQLGNLDTKPETYSPSRH